MTSPSGRSSLSELVRLFLRLGLTAFGGPAAHIGLMEREAVERRGWMSRPQFLDLVGACNLLPGPGSTQVAMALGYRRADVARTLLIGRGVSSHRIKVVSYGKERPVCTDATEDCYQRNRHAHLAPAQ